MKPLAALLLASTLASAAPPQEIHAEYSVASSGLVIGHVNESFERKDDHYTIRSVTRSEGLLRMFVDDTFTAESTGSVGAHGLQPLTYSEHRGKDSQRDLRSDFDWNKGEMRTVLHGENSRAPLPRETQDRVSMMYQFTLMKDFGATLVVPMADRRKIETFTYRFVGEEKLSTPAGEFATRHYQRVVNDPKETRADVWLARDRSNFPVRVVYDDPKRFRLEQTIVSLAISN